MGVPGQHRRRRKPTGEGLRFTNASLPFHGRHAELAREHAHDVRLGHESHLDEGEPNALAWRNGLLLQRLCQLLTRQQPLVDEEITEPFGGATRKWSNRSRHVYRFRRGRGQRVRGRRGRSLTLGWTVPPGKRHQRGEQSRGSWTDATYVTEAFQRLERTVLLTPRDDTGGERWADARQPLQFRGRRVVHVDRQHRRRQTLTRDCRPLRRPA